MVAFGHTALGTTIGLYGSQVFSISEPLTGLISTAGAGFISHYIADLIPHGHLIKFKDYRKKLLAVIFFDVFLGLVLFLGLAYQKFDLSLNFLYILFGIGGSQLPDIIDGLIYTKFLPNTGLLKLENTFHSGTHWHGDKYKALAWGKRDIWQVTVVIASLIFLLNA